MPHTDAKLLLLDSQEYSSALLQEELQRKGFTRVVHCDPRGDLRAVLGAFDPDVVIFNYHYDNQQNLAACAEVKRLAPSVPVVAIVSAGPALRLVSTWARETRQVDVVIEKPLSDERFFVVVSDLAAARRSAREQQAHLARLSNLVPEAALEAMNQNQPGEAEMFEAAVLFTDIRRSTEMISTLRPEDYFAALNRSLSAQTRVLEAGRGSIVKYTGDGVLAVFRGMGRNQLALRCAQALAGHDSQKTLPYGIGLAHGLILAGFVGDCQQAGRRSQYDVIGSTVHLAARLCSLASPGEVITTRSLHTAARAEIPATRPVGPVAIRGFAQSIDCVAFRSLSAA
jgi:class 3 adenylate cyclase